LEKFRVPGFREVTGSGFQVPGKIKIKIKRAADGRGWTRIRGRRGPHLPFVQMLLDCIIKKDYVSNRY
jgi:hypothetical protein